jgi:hypothetical protein
MDLFRAMREREAGIARVLAADRGEYADAQLSAIHALVRRGENFTSDDVRELAGDPPEGVHYNVAGAVMNRAAKAGLIVMVGFATSSRVMGHGNTVRIWRGSEHL